MMRRSGFTLIEILIAMAIVGILASAALVGLGSVQQTARDTRRIQDLRSVQTGLELYYRRNGIYPCAQSCPGPMAWGDLTTALQAVSGGSIIPSDPRESSGYAPYAYGSDGGSYVIRATLETDDNVLRADVDLAPFNIDCDDGNGKTFYCIQF